MSYPRPVDIDGNPTRFWVKSRMGPMVHLWGEAQTCRDVYDSFKYCSTKEITEHLGLAENKREWFQEMLRYFDGGWVPKEDHLWVSDFKQDAYKNHIVLPVDWSQYKDSWSLASEAYKYFLRGIGSQSTEHQLGLKRGSMDKMFRYFKMEWIPDKDPIWFDYFNKEA